MKPKGSPRSLSDDKNSDANQVPAERAVSDVFAGDETRFARAMVGSMDGIYEYSLKSDENYFSPRWLEIVGYDEGEIGPARASFLNLVHPDDVDNVEERMKALLEDRQVYDIEYRIRKKDGEYTWVRSRSKMFRDSNGDPLCISGSITDITDRKNAETLLRENEERFKDFAEVASDWYWETDENHVFSFVSDRYREITGLPRIYIIGRNRKQNSSGRTDDARWVMHLEDLENQRPFKNFVYEIESGDGRQLIVTVSGKPLFDAANNFRGYRGTARDVSQATLAEKALAESEDRYRSLIDLSPDAIMVVDESLRIKFVNTGTSKLLGAKTRAELLNTEFLKIVPPDFHDLMRERRAERIKSGHADFIEVDLLRFDGTTVSCEVAGTTIPWEGSQAALLITRDVTKRKEVDRLKSEFVSLVSHELRTPLTSIMGSISLILGGAVGLVPEKMSAMLSIAKSNSDRLISLVNNILDFEKLRSGGMEFDIRDVDLAELTNESLTLNQSYADKCSVSFVLDTPLEVTIVKADRDRIMQVLSNLLSNAAKFSSEGATVTVSVKRRNGIACVEVSDTGPGIPEDFRARIFDRFSQADAADDSAVQGTGLGLSISKAIIEQHDGKIDFDSRLGEGTTFFFELPTV